MLVAVDIETTGLDPETNSMLELGIGIYSDDFRLINSRSWLLNYGLNLIDQERFEKSLDPVVQKMHSKGNPSLLYELFNKAGCSSLQAENEAVVFLAENNAVGEPMTGSTISFDRAFLKKYMPHLEDTFHYRNIDVSSLKILSNMYFETNYPKALKLHRVLPDIQDTINDLEHFMEGLLEYE